MDGVRKRSEVEQEKMVKNGVERLVERRKKGDNAVSSFLLLS